MSQDFFKEAYDSQVFETLGKQLVEKVAEHLHNTTNGINQNTINWNPPEKELEFWKDYLKNGDIKDFFTEILKRTTHTHHPKYVGHQVGVSHPATLLTGMIGSLLNNGMAVYEMGMSPTAMERIVMDMVCQRIGYQENSRGFLTSGGTLANLTALLSARKANVTDDVWNDGHTKPLGIMVSNQAHYCVDRAAKIMGLGEKGIIKVPVDNTYTIDTSKLQEYHDKAQEEGISVFAIVGSAPSTATGVHDDLRAIGKFAKNNQLWFHVDGAHGGAGIFSKKYNHLLKGIEQADSVVIDGHKMMLMPTLTTALLFKNGRNAHATFNQTSDYLLDAEEDWYNSGKCTFECTKTTTTFHWYLLLKLHGTQLFDDYVTRQYDLAREFEVMLRDDPHFELATSPQSNILCFRIVDTNKSDEELNQLNAEIRKQLLEDGEFYIVQTKLEGKHYLRTTLMNPFTTKNHLNQLMDKIKAMASTINY